MDYTSERQILVSKLFHHSSMDDWKELAIQLFHFQYNFNGIYRKYINLLGINPINIRDIKQIPCLPIELFKSFEVKTGFWQPQRIFQSSGTGGQGRSKHCLKDYELFEKVSEQCFESGFGQLSNFAILAVLPSYQENPNSSLLSMINHFISKTQTSTSGYYPPKKDAISMAVDDTIRLNKIPIVFGVSYALLDLVEQGLNISNALIFETGGMKGKRNEMIKSELHKILKSGFGTDKIYSEYGMAELTAQAYSQGNGVFMNSRYLKIRCKEINDPFEIEKIGKTGVIECIDLSNLDTCCFIQTQDLGRMINQSHFEIMGRMHGSDLRGCNLIYDQLVN